MNIEAFGRWKERIKSLDQTAASRVFGKKGPYKLDTTDFAAMDAGVTEIIVYLTECIEALHNRIDFLEKIAAQKGMAKPIDYMKLHRDVLANMPKIQIPK